MIRHRFLRCANYTIHLREAGTQGRPAVLLLHGFSQNGGAFLPLMRAMATTHHLIAPDMPGRGLSQWARDAAAEYDFPRFIAVVEQLLEQLDISELSIVGTSMGGSMGIHMAAGSLRGRVQALVLNDMGMELPSAALDAALADRDMHPKFENFQDFRAYLTDVYVRLSKAELSNAEWTEFCMTSCRRADDGQYTIHHDPKIFTHFEVNKRDFALTDAFRTLACPITLLHAGRSGILTTTQVSDMAKLQPRLVVNKFPSKGHPLFLTEPTEIRSVQEALAERLSFGDEAIYQIRGGLNE